MVGKAKLAAHHCRVLYAAERAVYIKKDEGAI